MSFDLVQRLPSFIVQIERLFGISPFLALKVLISTLSHVIVLRKELWCIQSAYCTALFTQTQTPIRNCSQEIIKYLVLTYWIRAEVKAWALKIIIIIISEGHQKVVKWVRFLRLVRPTHELGIELLLGLTVINVAAKKLKILYVIFNLQGLSITTIDWNIACNIAVL